MKISEIISESFDSNVQGRLIRATNNLFTTRTTIGNRDIIFNSSSYEDDNNRIVWEIEFTEKSISTGTTYGKSGSGNELQVFSFVIESIKELISRYHPGILEFSSHKGDGNRSSLYKRIAHKVKMSGYHLSDINSNEHTDIFRIVKD